jgi:hypothetical protein
VVMLFAVERLSERSEDWPTNKKFLEVEPAKKKSIINFGMK